MIIEREKACALTGHRILKPEFSIKQLETELEKIILRGYDVFYNGVALGFDSACFAALLKLKRDYDIKIIACVPCPGQDKYFSYEQKEDYRYFLQKADKVVTVSPYYDEFCMKKRNHYMVDNASLLLAYLYNYRSGTYSTVKYALNMGVDVEYFKD